MKIIHQYRNNLTPVFWVLNCLLGGFVPGVFVCSAQGQSLSEIKGLSETRYFGSEQYNGGIQNYQFAQDQQGVLYVANNLGLLVYDGAFWERYMVRNGTKVRSVFTTPDGRIYVGAQNEIGYFERGATGRLTYTSLMTKLPPQVSDIDEVWNIYPSKSGLIFCTSNTVLSYENGQLNLVSQKEGLAWVFWVRGQLVGQFEGQGLHLYAAKSWQPIPFGDFFADKRVNTILPLSQNQMLVVTYAQGMYILGEEGVTPYHPNIQKMVKPHKITKAVWLTDGRLAIGTENNGIYLFEREGALSAHYTKGKGIEGRTILGIFEDRFHNIWLGLNNGICLIAQRMPHTLIEDPLGLPGAGYSAYYYQDRIYFGTSSGLFFPRKKLITDLSGKEIMQQVAGIQGQVYDITSIDGDILVGGHNGCYQIINEQAITISDDIGWWQFLQIPKSDMIIAGTYRGLVLMEKRGRLWRPIAPIAGFEESSRMMAFDAQGDLWIAHGYKGAFRIRLSEDFREVTQVNAFDERHGFPQRQLINLFTINQELVFTAARSTYSFDQATQRFVHHPVFSKYLGDDVHVRAMEEDGMGNIYFVTSQKTGVLKKQSAGIYEKITTPFNPINSWLNDDLVSIYAINQNNVVFASKSGFVHLDPTQNLPQQTFQISIRNISLIHSQDTIVRHNIAEDAPLLSVAYQDNAIRFRYAAHYFETQPVEYRLKLSGLDNEWTEWTKKTEKEYTNLLEGKYTLAIEARNMHGDVSEMHPFEFIVLPPWYRSTIAKFIYFLIALAMLFALVLWIRKRMEMQKRQLVLRQEEALQEKDHQIRQVSNQSKAEIGKLKQEKLQSEVNHKNKELALATMNLISKNEFIAQIKNKIRSIEKKEDNDKISRELQRLIKDIDRNLNHDADWQQFAYHFDQVHGDFLKRIKQDYTELTPQEIKLCAYLRMNMSTKEIANLLNISVRGVEVSRYRLRKKLQLETKINLSEFMMDY